ncbi:MAG: GNAT family N-acetyltransferase [Candidatus Nitrosothermus koennekii]|nr:MAG: GNAT family N-acetyltransferase [Candidatus Nitrosothermus koennekii]
MNDINIVKEWIRLKYLGYPANRYYVIEDNEIKGYILWIELGGFRKDAVIELEQIAITPKEQGKGLGSRLIKESLKDVIKELEIRGSRLKLVKVTTGTENQAQRLYKKALNAKPVAVIPDFFRGDEVILIARNDDLNI